VAAKIEMSQSFLALFRPKMVVNHGIQQYIRLKLGACRFNIAEFVQVNHFSPQRIKASEMKKKSYGKSAKSPFFWANFNHHLFFFV
jgi:hypothetical protein